MKILLGVTGGIAAYKTPELVRQFRRHGAQVQVVCTQNALELVSKTALETVSSRPVVSETFGPRTHAQVEHIDLANWPDAVVIAPATANMMAKMAHGIADDLLSTVLLATPAPVWIAPGMNTNMWVHPATQANLRILQERGVRVVGPDSGELACGTSGPGRMSEPEAIVRAVLERLHPAGPWQGISVLVSAGATREYIDPVRFITNPSTGRMGAAIARAARFLGANVIFVNGHMEVPVPPGVLAVPAGTAQEMEQAVFAHLHEVDVVIMTAAVGDFRPAQPANKKIKKDRVGLSWELKLVRNPDILARLAADRKQASMPILVGFAAETAGDDAQLEALAHAKLSAKGCDALFANDVSRPDAGFATPTNQGILVFSDGTSKIIPSGGKDQVALELLSGLSEKFPSVLPSVSGV